MRSDADLLETWNACGYYELIGMEVTHADTASARLEITIGPEHLQAYGTAHGGIVAGLLDAAMGLAAIARLPGGHGCATVDMTVSFTAPALPGELVGTGRVLHQGRRLMVAAGEAHDAEGRLVACAQGTFQAVAPPAA